MQPPRQRKSPDCAGLSAESSVSTRSVRSSGRSPLPAVIALIGGSIRAAAQSAQAAGFLVTGFDRFADLDALDACHRHFRIESGALSSQLQSIAEIGRQMPLVPVGGLGGLDDAWESLALMSPWPDQKEAIASVRRPEVLAEICQDTPFQVPETLAWPGTSSPGISCGTSSPGTSCGTSPVHHGQETQRWLCKATDSCGGLGTLWHQPGSGLVGGDRAYLQRWVEGRLFGASLISNGSETLLLGVCRSRFTRKGRYPFVYCGSIGPVSISEGLRGSLQALGSKLSLCTGLRGMFNLDFLRGSGDRLWLLEVNARWSGSSELIERHLRRRTGINSLLALVLEALDGKPLDRCPCDLAQLDPLDPLYNKRIIFARRDMTLDSNDVRRSLNENETLHDVPPPGRLISRGEPVCTLITRCVRSGEPYGQEASENESSPMRRHRALIQQLSGAVVG